MTAPFPAQDGDPPHTCPVVPGSREQDPAALEFHGRRPGAQRPHAGEGHFLPRGRGQQHSAKLQGGRPHHPAGARGPRWLALWREREDQDVSLAGGRQPPDPGLCVLALGPPSDRLSRSHRSVRRDRCGRRPPPALASTSLDSAWHPTCAHGTLPVAPWWLQAASPVGAMALQPCGTEPGIPSCLLKKLEPCSVLAPLLTHSLTPLQGRVAQSWMDAQVGLLVFLECVHTPPPQMHAAGLGSGWDLGPEDVL